VFMDDTLEIPIFSEEEIKQDAVDFLSNQTVETPELEIPLPQQQDLRSSRELFISTLEE